MTERYHTHGSARCLSLLFLSVMAGCGDASPSVTPPEGYATVLQAPLPTSTQNSGTVSVPASEPESSLSPEETRARNAALAELERTGITAIPMGHGIYVLNPRSNFRDNQTVNNVARDGAVPISFGPEFDRPPLDPSVEGLIRVFPQDPVRASVEDSIAETGRIVLRDGCFHAVRGDGSEALAIFPDDIALFRDGDGYLAFRYRYEKVKRSLPRVGSPARLGHVESIRPPVDLVKRCGQKPAVTISALSLPQSD